MIDTVTLAAPTEVGHCPHPTSPVGRHERFIADVRASLFTMPELCERSGIGRTVGYKWVNRTRRWVVRYRRVRSLRPPFSVFLKL